VEQEILIVMQDFKMRVLDPYGHLKELAEDYGTLRVGAMKRFFSDFDVKLRDFSAGSCAIVLPEHSVYVVTLDVA